MNRVCLFNLLLTASNLMLAVGLIIRGEFPSTPLLGAFVTSLCAVISYRKPAP